MFHISFTDVAAIRNHLIKLYEGATRFVQVTPLEEEGLPLPQIYGSVLIEQNLSAMKKTRKQDEPDGTRTLKSVKDMFYVKNKFARIIILTGEAGYGKTVFCFKLIDSWSKGSQKNDKAKKIGGFENTKDVDNQTEEIQGDESERGTGYTLGGTREANGSLQPRQKQLNAMQNEQEDRDMQSCLSLFDLVFYVPLRHAKHGIESIVNLVCDSVHECDQKTEHKIKQMLCDSNIQCLVILDGLDEYQIPDTCRVRGFPDRDGLVNCTLLCTMRPWRMISLQPGLDASFDKMVQIQGLTSSSVKSVISNILVNFHGLQLSSELYEEKFSRFCKKAKQPELKLLMRIPLMLTASCLVWNEEDENEIDQDTSYFMTFFYLKLKEIIITRAENRHVIVKSFFEKQQKPDPRLNLPDILLEFETIIDFIEILKPVGRLALEDLLSKEPHLVFPRNKIEREIGQSKVELAMKTGLLSQTKAPGLSYRQRVSLSFYHKSIQEFIAALYMTCGDSKALVSFRTHCNTVDKVMELSNMIMFVCGLDPMVGCKLSEHIKNVVNSDTDIIQYREKQENKYKIGVLYEMHCKWYSEMKQNLSFTHNTDRTPTLHVTDVCLDNDEDVLVASELVSMEDNSIVSVYLEFIEHPVHSIIQHLPRCKHLTALYIMDITDTQDRELLAEVLPQLVQLQCVAYGVRLLPSAENCPSADTAVVRAVQHLPALRRIKLDSITLTDTVTPLENVKLNYVRPAHFILPSLCRLTCIGLSAITLTDTVTLPPQLQKVELRFVGPAHFILPSLPECPHLTSLHIQGLYTMEDCEVVASVLPQLPHLQYINYNGDDSECGSAGHAAVVSALQHLTQLTRIKLSHIDLGDVGLLLKSHMTRLQKVKLGWVKTSPRRWREFVWSLLNVQHTVHVTLEFTDIDGDTVNIIHYLPNCTVKKESHNPDGGYYTLQFITFTSSRSNR